MGEGGGGTEKKINLLLESAGQDSTKSKERLVGLVMSCVVTLKKKRKGQAKTATPASCVR